MLIQKWKCGLSQCAGSALGGSPHVGGTWKLRGWHLSQEHMVAQLCIPSLPPLAPSLPSLLPKRVRAGSRDRRPCRSVCFTICRCLQGGLFAPKCKDASLDGGVVKFSETPASPAPPQPSGSSFQVDFGTDQAWRSSHQDAGRA